MRTLSSILALVIIFATLAAVPVPAWAAGLRVERQTTRAELSPQPASPETDFDDSLPIQSWALDGVIVSAALPVSLTAAPRCAERRVSHRAPYLGDADRCRDP